MTRRVAGLVRKGVPRTRAARLAGIGVSTFCRWMADGEAAKSGVYREFWAAICKAEDEAVRAAISAVTGLIGKADSDAVRLNAAKFYLTHCHPAEFSSRQEVRQTGPDGGPIQVQAEVAVRPVFSDAQLREMTPEQLEAALGVLVGRGAAGGGAQP